MSQLDSILADLGMAPRAIDGATLGALLARCELLREEPVFGGEAIRLLRCGARFVVQETTDEPAILLRAWDLRAAGEAFVNRRLEDYERQWDG